jgi:hypothetical protein
VFPEFSEFGKYKFLQILFGFHRKAVSVSHSPAFLFALFVHDVKNLKELLDNYSGHFSTPTFFIGLIGFFQYANPLA